MALVIAAPLAEVRAQWPGALCYELSRGAWTRADRAGPAPQGLTTPDLIVLDSARRGALLGLGDAPDTVGRVVHGLVRNPPSSTAGYAGYGGERWFSGWTRPTADSVTARLGTGHGGVEFRFRIDRNRLVGVVDSYSDYGAVWTARVVGRRVRCPPGPPRLGRLRVSVVESPGRVSDAYLPLPEVDLELSTEEAAPCGSWIDYSAVRSDTLLAVTLQGLAGKRCDGPPGRAATKLGAMLGAGRYTVLVGHPTGADTNRFTVTVTDSSLHLATVRSTFVTADERPQRRTPHNLFEVRCGHRRGRALCDEIETWLVGLRGITRPTPFPQRKQLGPDTWVALFRYDSRATFDRVRACVGSIAEGVRRTDDVYVAIRTWLGEHIEASSEGRASDAPVPSGLTRRGPCAG